MPARQRMRPCACGRRPVSCPTCYGSGTLFNGNKCIICNGSGTVICPDCGGTGKLWDWEEIPEENSSYSVSSYPSYSGSSYGGIDYSSFQYEAERGKAWLKAQKKAKVKSTFETIIVVIIALWLLLNFFS